MSRLRQPPRDRGSGDAATDDDHIGRSSAGSRGLDHRSVLLWMTPQHDATLYSTLAGAGSREPGAGSREPGVGSREATAKRPVSASSRRSIGEHPAVPDPQKFGKLR